MAIIPNMTTASLLGILLLVAPVIGVVYMIIILRRMDARDRLRRLSEQPEPPPPGKVIQLFRSAKTQVGIALAAGAALWAAAKRTASTHPVGVPVAAAAIGVATGVVVGIIALNPDEPERALPDSTQTVTPPTTPETPRPTPSPTPSEPSPSVEPPVEPPVESPPSVELAEERSPAPPRQEPDETAPGGTPGGAPGDNTGGGDTGGGDGDERDGEPGDGGEEPPTAECTVRVDARPVLDVCVLRSAP